TLIFRSNRAGAVQFYRARTAEPGAVEVLLSAEAQRKVSVLVSPNVIPGSVSPDGRVLMFSTIGSGAFDLWRLNLADRKIEVFQVTPANEMHPTISPDGKWVAYTSDETGRLEVYLQSFPSPGHRRQVSTGGGLEPRWRADGSELFYLAADRRLMAVPVTAGQPGTSVALFATAAPKSPSAYRRNYDVAPDGKKFLVNSLIPNQAPPAITVVLNWTAGLK
ncbi:MAG: TolB family protein, partial [Bryobacteraceae bacterium]